MLTWSGDIGTIGSSARHKVLAIYWRYTMKAVKAVLTTVTVWHVAGKVNLAKCNLTGKFIKNAIGQYSLDTQRDSKKTNFVFCCICNIVFVIIIVSYI